MNIATGITLAIVAVVLIAIVVREIKNRKSGKHSCSCGGSCSACPMGCCTNKDEIK